MDRVQAKEIYDDKFQTYEAATKRLQELLESLLTQLSDTYGVREGSWVSGKAKDFNSFYEKAKDDSVTDVDSCLRRVHDFARARVVVQTVDDVYRLVKLLDEQNIIVLYWPTVEDWIKKPNKRGYRSYHIDVGVDVPSGPEMQTINCELQIRSAIQHAWSGFSHKDFYKGMEIPAVYEDQMTEMANLLASVDRMAANLILRLNDEKQKNDKGVLPPPASERPEEGRLGIAVQRIRRTLGA